MKPKILIVDDDIAITQQLFWSLCDSYEVMTANNAQAALRRATIYEPAVSIVDLHLPPLADSPESGLRILEYIKSRFPESKVVMMSSAEGRELREACIKGGADAVFSKPLDLDELMAVLSVYADPGDRNVAV
jgi:DNA-binding response OmpR family regulator